MKRTAKIILLLSFITQITVAQKEANIWYFGDHAGLDFNNGAPVALTNGAAFAYDNTTAVSDSSGALQFYCNGSTVWNKNHVIMNNGSGLNGSNNGGQCAVIVPQPLTSLYYIFTVDQFVGPNGFNYSIVDISMNGGLGQVISKNNNLFSPSTERIDSYYNCVDNSYWVVTHQWGNNSFAAYKITSGGLVTTPVISNVGFIQSGATYNALGQITISPGGNKLACTVYDQGLVEFFDFDKTTGVVSNPQTISGYYAAWGVSFSPDESKLYVTQWYGTDVLQFDLNAGSLSNIIASLVNVGTVTGPGTNGYYVGYLQMGPDNKIYIAKYDDNYIGAINSPDSAGLSCGFVDNAVSLGTHTCQAGLCRTVRPVYPIQNAINTNGFCVGDSTYFSLTDININSILWNFGDPLSGINNSATTLNSVHIFSDTGTYLVTAILNYNCYSDTIFTSISIASFPIFNLGNDTTLCTGASILLSVPSGYTSYSWQDGSNDSSYTATITGNYFVTVNNSGCTNTDSISLQFNPCSLPAINFASSDTNFCEKNCIDFFDLSTNNPTSWQWYFPGGIPDTSTMQNPTGICYNGYGNFSVTLFACNASGCDSLTINQFINEIQNPIDSIWISNDTLYSLSFPSYQWYSLTNGLIAGATNQYYVPVQPGSYYCMTTDSIGCVATSNAISITANFEFASKSVGLQINPNPSNGNFHISFGRLSAPFEIQIVDVIGKVLFKSNVLQSEISDYSIKLNLESSIYFLRVFANDNIYIQKFVIERNE